MSIYEESTFTATGDNVWLFEKYTPNTSGSMHYVAPLNVEEDQLDEWRFKLAQSSAPNCYGFGVKNLMTAVNGYVDIQYYPYISPGGRNIQYPEHQKPGEQTPPIDPQIITYVIIQYPNFYKYVKNETQPKYYFYFVKRVELLADRVRFYITADLWAQYVDRAMFSNLRLIRSNFEPSAQPYGAQPILFTVDEKHIADEVLMNYFRELTISPKLTTFRDLRFYAAIRYNVDKSIDSSLTRVGMFTILLRDLVTDDEESNPSLKLLRGYAKIQNIYEHNSNDAEVLKLYLYARDMPAEIIPTSETYSFQTLNENGGKVDLTLELVNSGIGIAFDVDLVKGNKDTQRVSSAAKKNYISDLTRYPVYFGTKYNQLKLPAFVGEMEVICTVENSGDKLTFNVTANGESRDISSAFELPCNVNSDTPSSLERVSKWLGILGNAASGVFQIASGGAGVVTGALSLAQTATQLITPGNGKYLPAGNAFATYERFIRDPDKAHFEFGITTHTATSTDSVKADAQEVNERGASCDIWIGSPRGTDGEAHSGLIYALIDQYGEKLCPQFLAGKTASVGTVPDFVFIQTDSNLAVDNIPQAAAEYIASALASGVKIYNNYPPH